MPSGLPQMMQTCLAAWERAAARWSRNVVGTNHWDELCQANRLQMELLIGSRLSLGISISSELMISVYLALEGAF